MNTETAALRTALELVAPQYCHRTANRAPEEGCSCAACKAQAALRASPLTVRGQLIAQAGLREGELAAETYRLRDQWKLARKSRKAGQIGRALEDESRTRYERAYAKMVAWQDLGRALGREGRHAVAYEVNTGLRSGDEAQRLAWTAITAEVLGFI